jgi:MscS family membrane protein
MSKHGTESGGTLRLGWWAAMVCASMFVLLVGPASRSLAQPTLKEVLEHGKPKDTQGDEATKSEPKAPVDELNRGAPRTSIEGFLVASRAGDWERAAKYLDLRQLPQREVEQKGPRLAKQLKIVLDRSLWIDLDALSDLSEGYTTDGLPLGRDLVGQIETPDGGTVQVLMQRVPRGDGVSIWKISSATVARIPRLWEYFGSSPMWEWFPPALLDTKVAGLSLAAWIVLMVIIGVSALAGFLATGAMLLVLSRWSSRFGGLLHRFVTGPVRLMIAVLVFSAIRGEFSTSLAFQGIFGALENTLLILSVAWILLRLVDVGGQAMADRLLRRGQVQGIALIPGAARGAKVVLVACAGVFMMQTFGYEVTALMAGLGIGGVAIALAAQRSLENLIGGVTIYADQPLRVGDFCRFGDRVGTIEAVGLRSTRVRTLDRTIVSIPNADFSDRELENFSVRDKIWFHPRIGLRYETSPDQIRYILVEVRKMLYAHPRVDPDPARIRFVGFGAYSLDLEIFAYVKTTDYGEYLEVAEDLNLRIMDIVAEAGSSFAFPSQTTYVENGAGLNEERARRAEGRVHEWRERNELFLPGFPRAKIQELENSLDYPPNGSPRAGSGHS